MTEARFHLWLRTSLAIEPPGVRVMVDGTEHSCWLASLDDAAVIADSLESAGEHGLAAETRRVADGARAYLQLVGTPADLRFAE